MLGSEITGHLDQLSSVAIAAWCMVIGLTLRLSSTAGVRVYPRFLDVGINNQHILSYMFTNVMFRLDKQLNTSRYGERLIGQGGSPRVAVQLDRSWTFGGARPTLLTCQYVRELEIMVIAPRHGLRTLATEGASPLWELGNGDTP